MEFAIALVLIIGLVVFLIIRARKPNTPPDYGDAQPPHEATPDEIAEFWRNRGN